MTHPFENCSSLRLKIAICPSRFSTPEQSQNLRQFKVPFRGFRGLSAALFLFLILTFPAFASFTKLSSVTYTAAQLTSTPTKTLIVRSDGISAFDPSCIKPVETMRKFVLHGLLNTGADYDFGKNTVSASLTLQIKAYSTFSGTSGLLNTYSRSLAISQCAPEQTFTLDLTPLYLGVQRIEVSVSSPSVSSALSSVLQLNVFYTEDLVTSVTNVIPTVNTDIVYGSSCPGDHSCGANPVKFAWNMCSDIPSPNYQLQVLRLYNRVTYTTTPSDENITADVDWNKALTVETGSPDKQISLTLAEGAGYYVWRVRPIGTFWPGGIANDLNWGSWSTSYTQGSSVTLTTASTLPSYVFFYNQFNDGLNWIYSRNFVEGEPNGGSQVVIGEHMSFANGLQQLKQSQAHLQSDQKIIANQTIQDFSGRASLTTMPAPLERNSLGYEFDFVRNPSGTVYTAVDYDADGNYNNPSQVQVAGGSVLGNYYSNSNSDATIPSAEGYPYSRVIYFRDGTNRPKEQSSPGATHRIGATDVHTVRNNFASASNTELIRIFGDEAPEAESVHKVITTDANNTSSINYISKEGQTIATCLSSSPDNPLLDHLASATGSTFTVTEAVTKNVTYGTNGVTSTKHISFTVPTTLVLTYDITPKIVEDACESFCRTCDYKVTFFIHNVNDPSATIKDSLIVNPSNACTASTVSWSGTHSFNLSAGDYVIERRVEAYNYSDATKITTYLDLADQALIDQVTGVIDAALSGARTYLNSGDLDGLYSYWGIGTDDVSKTITIGCDAITVPITRCRQYSCPGNAPDFEGYLISHWNGRAKSGGGTYGSTFSSYPGLSAYSTSGSFNTMISNMLNDTYVTTRYTCDPLWKCWDGVVQSLDNLYALSTTAQPYSVLKTFLDCAGRQMRTNSTTPTTTSFTSPGYLSHPYACFNYAFSTTTPTNCEKGLACPTTGTCTTGDVTTFFSTATSSDWKNFYNCVQLQGATGSTSASISDEKIIMEDACKDACKARFNSFVTSLIEEYEEHHYHVLGRVYPNPAITTIGDIPMSQIYCQAQQLVDHCAESCTLTIVYNTDPTPKAISLGTSTEITKFAQVMYAPFELELFSGESCPAGFEPTTSVSEPQNELLVKYLNAQIDKFSYDAGINGGCFNVDEAVFNFTGYHLSDCFTALVTPPPVVTEDGHGYYFHKVQAGSNACSDYQNLPYDGTLPICTTPPSDCCYLDEFITSHGTQTPYFSGPDPDCSVFGHAPLTVMVVNKNNPFVTGASYQFTSGAVGQLSYTGSFDLETDFDLIPNSDYSREQNFDICPTMPSLSCAPVCIKWIDPVIPGTPDVVEPPSCAKENCDFLLLALANQEAAIAKKHSDAFREAYKQNCASSASLLDHFAISYSLSYYHYTLYYYDRAGNLVKTVPPEGVDLSSTTRGVHPNHHYVTEYASNSVKETQRQLVPDATGDTKYVYDYKGRLRFSQNAKQLAASSTTYSYTKYDELGRIIEVGESPSITIANVDDQSYPSSGTRTERTLTYYTDAANIHYFAGKTQRFLQNRVSYSIKDEDGDLTTKPDQVSTFFSYDPHGNVEWLIHNQSEVGLSYLAYEYDLISGSVIKVKYNEELADRFFHRYTYDADKRIKLVETSSDGIIWDRDATYDYYAHGPLKRTGIGEDKVQGLDYIYTINGWLKAMNHPDLSTSNDPGADGATSGAHTNTGKDAYAMALGYFAGDFNRSGSPFNSYASPLSTNLNGVLADNSGPLYNGNITSWTNNIDFASAPTHTAEYKHLTGNVYRYDDLNRLHKSRFRDYTSGAFADNDDYNETFTYDANGNITHLTRNGYTGTSGPQQMDDLSYTYTSLTNKLDEVTDAEPDAGSKYTTDINPSQSSGNYTYDEIGNLKADAQEGITAIDWNIYGKVKSVTKSSGDVIKFLYNASGNRVLKELVRSSTDPSLNEKTFYVPDATGNTMSIYKRTNTAVVSGAYTATYNLIEQPIFGSKRIGSRTESALTMHTALFHTGDPDPPVSTTYLNTQYISAFTNMQVPVRKVLTAAISLSAVKTLNTESTAALSDNQLINYSNPGTNTASIDDDCGNIILSAYTSASYNGNPNVMMIFNGSGYLISKSNGIASTPNSQSIFMPVPGKPNQYYLFTIGADGTPYYSIIDAAQNSMIIKNNPMPNGLGIYPGTDTYGKTMALLEDKTGNYPSQLFLRYYVSPSETGIISFEINDLGIMPAKLLASFASADYQGTGDIQISPDATHLAVANNTSINTLGWLYTGKILEYSMLTNHKEITLQTTYTIPSLKTGIKSLAYTQSGAYLYFTGSSIIKCTAFASSFSCATNVNGLSRLNVSSLALVKNISGFIGDVRRGKNNNMYASNKNALALATVSTPEATATLGSLAIGTANTRFTGGMPQQRLSITNDAPACSNGIFSRTLNRKVYELTDHLGNVRATISDIKNSSLSGTTTSNYTADITSYNSYYAFGSPMPGRTYNPGDYRYSFNGLEGTPEVSGTGNHYTTEFRELDPRLGGRWWSRDPKAQLSPGWSPYCFTANNPIKFIDIDGLEPGEPQTSDKPALVKSSSATVTPSPGTQQYSTGNANTTNNGGLFSTINSYLENQMNKPTQQKIGVNDGSKSEDGVKTPTLAKGGMLFDISSIIPILKIFTKDERGGTESYSATSGSEGTDIVEGAKGLADGLKDTTVKINIKKDMFSFKNGSTVLVPKDTVVKKKDVANVPKYRDETKK
jgi:RHS repeat-associated protein